MDGALLPLLVLAAGCLVLLVGIGSVGVLIKLGVIAVKALEPPVEDEVGRYDLDGVREPD